MNNNQLKYCISFCGIVFIILYVNYYISFLATNWEEYLLNIELLSFIWLIKIFLSKKGK